MVLVKVEGRTQSTWKPVSRPAPKLNLPLPAGPINAPPAIGPKPRGKMYFYVYEVPSRPLANTNGQSIHYPRSDECVRDRKAKWKQQARKVLPNSVPKPTTRGGKMFQKQRKRMNEYILTNLNDGNETQRESYPVKDPSDSKQQVYFVPNKPVPAGSKNMPAYINNTMAGKYKKTKMRGPTIRPLRSPPPEWKAKVDSNYSISDHVPFGKSKWAREDLSFETGYDSAPPEETIFDEDDEYYDGYPQQANSVPEWRASSTDGLQQPSFYYYPTSSSTLYHIERPQVSRAAFLTAPYVENDFNARPVGWSREFAEQY